MYLGFLMFLTSWSFSNCSINHVLLPWPVDLFLSGKWRESILHTDPKGASGHKADSFARKKASSIQSLAAIWPRPTCGYSTRLSLGLLHAVVPGSLESNVQMRMPSVIDLCCRSSEVELRQLKGSDNVRRIKEQTRDDYERPLWLYST
jgi:hypothetical protein